MKKIAGGIDLILCCSYAKPETVQSELAKMRAMLRGEQK